VKGLTTEAIAARVRAVALDPKRVPSMRGPEGWQPWLESLAREGLLVCQDGAWQPTPIGEVWLREIALTVSQGEAAAA
jgi:hypothetical protein